MMTRTKKKCYHIDKEFLPIKLSYFTLFAALAALLPFLPMALTQLGLSPSEAAQIYGVIPFLSAVMRVIMGVIADKLQAHKSILMIFCVATGTIFLGLMFVPKQPSESCGTPTEQVSAVLCFNEEQASMNLCITGELNQVGYKGNDTMSMALNCSWTNSCGTINVSVSANITHRTYTRDSDCVSDHSGHAVCFDEIQHSEITFLEKCIDELQEMTVVLNCSAEVENACLEQNTKYGKTFWIAMSICLLGYFAFAPTTGLMHAIAYAMLGNNRNEWGKQRYFGTLGFLVSALAIGLTLQLTSDGKDTNLTANFIIYFGLFVVTAGLVYLYKMPKDVQCGSLLVNLKTLIKNPIIDALFALIFGLGIIMGAIETFLLLYIKELGGTELLLGLSLFMNCVMEVPALYFADVYLGKFGYVNCLYLTCVAFALRFLGYGLIHNAWLVLLINCLNSITFGVMYCAAGAYGSANTPPAMHGTMQGAIQALHFGFGRGIGGIVSGQIVEYHGMRKMFFIFSGVSMALLVLYFLAQCFLPKQVVEHKKEDKLTDIETPSQETEKIKADEEMPLDNIEDTKHVVDVTSI